MYLFYSFLYTLGSLFFLPRALFQKKYSDGFSQRMGNLPKLPADGMPVVWLHCVSVGETQAARSLFDEISQAFPDYKIVVSTTTFTGQSIARKLFQDKASLIFYFPFDWRFTVKRALKTIKPEIVLIMETELWFNFLRETRKSGAKIVLVNGRLSEKSQNRYSLIPKFIKRVLFNIELALMQTNEDARRLIKLGMRTNKVKVTGNIKFDQKTNGDETELTEKFRKRFGISKEAPLIVAASTHSPEEEWILQAFKETWKTSEKLPRLLLVPRHPERFDEVAELIKKTGFEWARTSEQEAESDKSAEIILLDSIGELRAMYPLAEIVFVGGSLIKHGGQNILEPAHAGKPIVTGFYTMNFSVIVKEFVERSAVIQLPEIPEKDIPAKLSAVFRELLQDGLRRSKLAENAYNLAQFNRGATEKTIDFLKPFFQVHNITPKQRLLPHLQNVQQK